MKVVSSHKPEQSVSRILYDLEVVIAAAHLLIPNTTSFFDKDQPLSFISFFMGCFLGSSRSFFDAKSLSIKELFDIKRFGCRRPGRTR
jgi:hypothetical protein